MPSSGNIITDTREMFHLGGGKEIIVVVEIFL
jgi:hypothetical protein